MSNNRQSNFELLRVICALMIIAGHVIMIHGNGSVGSPLFVVNICLRPWFMCAVNVFVLLSGYFGIKTNAKKLWQLNDMVTFYSVVLLVIACIWGGHSFDIKRDALFLIPVLTKQYWFITVYFALCLLAPALNYFVEKSDKLFLKRTILTSVCLFILVPSLGFLLNFDAIVDDSGYGIVNFCLLYLIGRYFKIYDALTHYSKTEYIVFYMICMLIDGLFQLFFSNFLGFPFTSFLSYNTLFIFLGSLALFAFFSRIQIGINRFINLMSSFCLCSYVIHLHPIAFSWFFDDLLHVPDMHGPRYLGTIFFIPVVVYFLCALVETVRRLLYKIFIACFLFQRR